MTMAAKIYDSSVFIMVAMTLVSMIIYGIKGISETLQLTPKQIIFQIVLSVILFVSCYSVTGTILKAGYLMGETILPSISLQAANDEIRKVLDNQLARENVPATGGNPNPNGAGSGAAGWMVTLFNALSPLTGLTVADIVTVFCGMIFAIATFFMNLFWLVLVLSVVIFGPLVMALGPLPGIGLKLMGNYFKLVFELSLWQVWMHTCGWFLTISEGLLLSDTHSNSFANGQNSYTLAESAGMALVFTVMYLATGSVVRAFFPFGALGQAIGGILQAKGLVTNGIMAPVSIAAGAAAGAITGGAGMALTGAAGAAGGRIGGFARIITMAKRSR